MESETGELQKGKLERGCSRIAFWLAFCAFGYTLFCILFRANIEYPIKRTFDTGNLLLLAMGVLMAAALCYAGMKTMRLHQVESKRGRWQILPASIIFLLVQIAICYTTIYGIGTDSFMVVDIADALIIGSMSIVGVERKLRETVRSSVQAADDLFAWKVRRMRFLKLWKLR